MSGPVIVQLAPVSWSNIGSTILANPVANETNLIPAIPGIFYQLMGIRIQIAQDTKAAVAAAYPMGIVAKSGGTVTPLYEAAVYVPTAALVGAGPLFDSGWMRFDPVGLGNVSFVGYEIDFYTPVALTGAVAILLAWNALPGG